MKAADGSLIYYNLCGNTISQCHNEKSQMYFYQKNNTCKILAKDDRRSTGFSSILYPNLSKKLNWHIAFAGLSYYLAKGDNFVKPLTKNVTNYFVTLQMQCNLKAKGINFISVPTISDFLSNYTIYAETASGKNLTK